ncbi:MAG TPA: ATP-binding protein [Thermoanaerobaculia bacterium]|nr:ATP-binding protein [Thermoanaerobaculia bacterium]
MIDPGLAAIGRLTDAMSRSATLASVYEAALDALQSGLGVERASILLFDDSGVMNFVAWRGLSDAYRSVVNGHTPWSPETRDAEPIVVPDVQADASLTSYLPVFAGEGIRALGFFPLIYDGYVIGKFMLYFARPHAMSEGDVQLAQTIAGQIAFGVVRVRAEEALRRERDRATFLAEASHRLASSLDYEQTLEHVAQSVVRELADWCAIDLVEDGELRRIAVTHRHPEERADALQKMRSYAPSRQRSGGIRRVIDTATPELVRSYDWKAFEAAYANEPEIIEAFRQMGIESFITVPLTAHGQQLGAMTLVSSSRERLFDEYDLALAVELGRRAGYAIDNARHYSDAQEANKAKDEFLITLSHELRTPMTATLGWASMLRRDLSPENFALAVDTIERSSRAQAQLIDDILDVSRIVTGKLQLEVAPVELRQIVERAVDAIRPSAQNRKIELRLTLADVPSVVIVDASRLQQVLWNLLSNAVKFTPAGGRIVIELHEPGNRQARITVRDTGIGIPRRFLPHIFERFRQADSGTSRAHGGLGLGLAIVKSLVELHGGTVVAESEGEGAGTTFTITLPLATPSLPAAALHHERADVSLEGLSVLLVEDDDDTRHMLTTTLTTYGANVTAVATVAAALDSMREAAPHVLLSDIGLPEHDGYELMLHLRANASETLRSVRAIALTAYASPDDRQRVLASGFDHHLAKPVDPLTVVHAVRDAADVSRSRAAHH